MHYCYKRISLGQLDMIRPLWEELNRIHIADARYFKDYYENYTFEERCKKFKNLAEEDIFIQIIIIQEDNRPVGFCISTRGKEAGEISALFVEGKHRKQGHGGCLLQNGLKWLKEKGLKRIVIPVAEGHESVFGYYRKFGFYPRRTYLEQQE